MIGSELLITEGECWKFLMLFFSVYGKFSLSKSQKYKQMPVVNISENTEKQKEKL